MAAIVSAVLVSALTGCQGGETGEKTSVVDPKTAAESPTGEPEEFRYPMEQGETLSWWKDFNPNVAANFTSMGDTPVMKGLSERTGVSINFLHPPTGQAKEQFSLILADGDLPDIMEYNWLSGYPGGPQKAITDGIILPLNDIIDQYCPNLKAYLDDNPEIDKMVKTDNGDYYVFPAIKEEAETIQIGPMMRADWLEELNFEVPETIDEWYMVLKAFKEEKGLVAPFSFQYTNAIIRDVNPIVLAYVISPNYYVGEDGTVRYGSIEAGYRQYLETMSGWYKEGLLDIDLISQKAEQVSAKVTSGQTGASVGYTEGNMGAWITAGQKETSEFSLVGVPWPTLENGQKPKSGQTENKFSGAGAVAITSSCKDVERAARLLDYMFSEEGYMYGNFGEEGVSYTMEEGKPQFTDVIMNNPDGWTIKSALTSYTMSSGGAPHVRDPRVPEQTMAAKELMDARYHIWSNTDARKYLIPPVTPNKDESKEFATIMNEITTYRDEMTIKYIMGLESLDTFDDYVANIKKLGIDRAIEIQTAALERYHAR